MRPRLLDLFCCAGGIARGYHDAGFEVVGVDIQAQPDYPYAFVRADVAALTQRDSLLFELWDGVLGPFDVIHASPPCQARSDLQKQSKLKYEEFVPRVREMLIATGLPYVIENVEGTTDIEDAALVNPVRICGAGIPGLRVIRHRLFESNVPLVGIPCPAKHPLCFTHDKRKAHYGKLDQNTAFVQVTGGGNATVVNKAAAMGIDWMTGAELNEAIPPAYGEHIGRQLIAAIRPAMAT